MKYDASLHNQDQNNNHFLFHLVSKILSEHNLYSKNLSECKKAEWFGKEKAVKVSTEFAQKRTIIEIITANGKIQPETGIKAALVGIQ